MNHQADRKFHIGISAKLFNTDGTAAIREFDIAPLVNNPQIVVSRLPDVDTGDLLHDSVKELDAAILFLERISSKTFAANTRLSVLARYGVGYDTLDIPACTAAGVAVAIAPSGVRRPVATSVIGLMLALTLNMKVKDRITRDVPDGWLSKTQHNGMGLVGRTLAGIGLGNIGAEVFRLAAPFDMNLIACDPYVSPEFAQSIGVRLVSLDEVFQQADILTVNCQLNDETHHLVNAERLAKMKPTAYLINTARGPVIEEPALISALQENRLQGAGLDVFELEPPDINNPLLHMDKVILAPHALCFTDQCMGGLGEADIKACMSVMYGRAPDSLVDPEIVNNRRFSEILQRNRNTFRNS